MIDNISLLHCKVEFSFTTLCVHHDLNLILMIIKTIMMIHDNDHHILSPLVAGRFFLDQSLSMIIDHELIIIWTMDCSAFFKKLICETISLLQNFSC